MKKEQYKKFLLSEGKAISTVGNYVSAINLIERTLGRRIWEAPDAVVDRLLGELRAGGKHSSLGESRHGAPKAAVNWLYKLNELNQDVEFQAISLYTSVSTPVKEVPIEVPVKRALPLNNDIHYKNVILTDHALDRLSKRTDINSRQMYELLMTDKVKVDYISKDVEDEWNVRVTLLDFDIIVKGYIKEKQDSSLLVTTIVTNV